MEQFTLYTAKVFSGTTPIFGCILAAINYILFPDEAFMTAAIAVGVTIILDIITKYVAIAAQEGGYLKAVKNKKIRSDALWCGTKIKIYSYLVVAILAGLSYRVVQLEQVSVFFATVVYSILFLRETQSIVENLCDSGAHLGWLSEWAKRKEKIILDEQDEPIKDENKPDQKI